MKIKSYDVLVIDEGQDLNHCQQELALRAGEYILLVGDKHQAIYGFAGADTESMITMHCKLEAKEMCHEFPLTETRRCSKAVVREAQQIVPEFTAHPNNLDGEVTVAMSLRGIQSNDMILCRTNAPLISQAFLMMSDGIAVTMLGRKPGLAESLVSLIELLKADSIQDLRKKLDRFKHKELARLTKAKCKSDSAIITVTDRCNCLYNVIRHSDTIGEVITHITDLHENKANAIRVSSIHQAKGLEARNVWILKPELLPHPMARTSWQLEQEENLKYVAITRSIDTLTWLESEE